VNPCVRSTIALGIVAFLCACSATLPPPGADRGGLAAASATAKVGGPACADGRAWQEALDALPSAAVTGIEPMYVRDTCMGTVQVTGVKLALLPGAVESAPWAGLLECGMARVPFAKASPPGPSASPIWTPDGWVDIAVERDRRTVVLTVSAESVPKNIRLFRRVAAFARSTRE
jgi:hypothetical protein